MPDLFFGWVGIYPQEFDCVHDHTGSAEAALKTVIFVERRLHRVQRVADRHALDGRDLAPVGCGGQHGAGFHRLAVDMNDASPALAGVTPDVCACKPLIITQKLRQQRTAFDLARRRLGEISSLSDPQILCIGDGIGTDVQGGISEGLDTLFITGGLAAAETKTDRQPDAEALEVYVAKELVSPTYAIGFLR